MEDPAPGTAYKVCILWQKNSVLPSSLSIPLTHSCVWTKPDRRKNKAAEEVNNVVRTIITGPLKTWTSEKGNTFFHVLRWRTHNYLEIPFNHVQIPLLNDLNGLVWMWISCENLEIQKTKHPHTSAEREQPVLQDLSCICSCIHQVQFSDYANCAQTWENIINYILVQYNL